MNNASQTRILAVVLAVATVAACVLAAMNFDRESGLDVPTDGIWWVEAAAGLWAERVPALSPGHRAGILHIDGNLRTIIRGDFFVFKPRALV